MPQAKGLEVKVMRAESEIEENAERVRVMTEHLRSIQQELQQTQVPHCMQLIQCRHGRVQSLYDARKRQVDDESHLRTICSTQSVNESAISAITYMQWSKSKPGSVPRSAK